MYIRHLLTATIPLILLLLSAAWHLVVAQSSSGGDVLPLWAEGAPYAEGDAPEDQPAMTVFLPDEEKATGAGVVIFPGGGYRHLAMEHEGYDVARWLNELGVAAFVVKYRLGERYHHPVQLGDAQRAIRLARANAEKWGVEPGRIGILGFSAGGHLASTAGTHFDAGNPEAADLVDRHNSRPDFMVLIYPVITMQKDYTHRGSLHHLLGENPQPELVDLLSNERQVTEQTPPTFILHTTDDAIVPVQNSVQFYLSLVEHDVPAEMHLFGEGPHGFGLAPDNPTISVWTSLCEQWMRSRGIIRQE